MSTTLPPPMPKPMPLTDEGFEQELDRFLDDQLDVRPLKEWARGALLAGGWGHVAALLDCLEWIPPGESSQSRARAALRERRDGMPESLERALIEGWVRLDGQEGRHLNVWDHEELGWRHMTFGISAGSGWDTGGGMYFAPRPVGGWTEEESAELLALWPDVVAWHDGGAPAPWDQP